MICYDKDQIKSLKLNGQHDEWEDNYRFGFFKHSNKKLYTQEANNSNKYTNKLIIDNDYYYRLLPLFEEIFEIEDDCHKIVKQIWNKSVSCAKDYAINESYGLIVKNLNTFNKTITGSIQQEYMDSRVGCSTSFITNNKSAFFRAHRNRVGLTFDLNDGFLGSYQGDAYLSEKINGECPIHIFSREMKFSEFNCVAKIGNSKVYSHKATKIGTPKSILKENDTEYNEVIVDNNKIKATAVFYIENRSMDYANKVDENDNELLRAQELSEKMDLPLITFRQHNKYLDETDVWNKNKEYNKKHNLNQEI